jgi:hypothetical protein
VKQIEITKKHNIPKQSVIRIGGLDFSGLEFIFDPFVSDFDIRILNFALNSMARFSATTPKTSKGIV